LPFLHRHKGDFLKPGRRDSRDKGWGDIVRVTSDVARPRPRGDFRPHVGVRIGSSEGNQGPA